MTALSKQLTMPFAFVEVLSLGVEVLAADGLVATTLPD